MKNLRYDKQKGTQKQNNIFYSPSISKLCKLKVQRVSRFLFRSIASKTQKCQHRDDRVVQSSVNRTAEKACATDQIPNLNAQPKFSKERTYKNSYHKSRNHHEIVEPAPCYCCILLPKQVFGYKHLFHDLSMSVASIPKFFSACPRL